MTGFTDLAAKTALDWVTGKTTPGAVATRYLALFSVAGVDAGTGFTEISGAGYARQDLTTPMAAATGSSPSTATTSSGITFPTSTADWTSAGTAPVIAWGDVNHLSNAVSGTTLLAWDYLGNYLWLPATVSVASPGVFTCPAHGYSVGDPVVFTTEFGGSAPTASAGVLTGTLKINTVPDANSFTVASGATFNSSGVLTGGTVVNISAVGNGMVRKITAQLVPNGVQVVFNTGNIVLSLA
jgi:hypothetical protein